MRTALLVFVLVCSAAWAGPVVVGVKVAEPFVIEREDGTLGGLAIRLWEGVAEDLGVEYRYETRPDVASLLAGVGSGEFAVGVGAVTVTRDREELVDFTHPYYTGGLGIAVDADGGRPGFVRTMAAIWTPAFITGVTGLVVLLMGVGLVVWFVERRKNADQFGGGVLRGLGSGFWFSAVTMTTVGYGDKTPITPMGRVVALVWMFASIIVISFFTGAIASAFTASRLGGVVQGPEDLPRARVGVVDGTAGQDRLLERGVQARGFESVDAGLAAIADGSLDAFVHDEALVRYRTTNRFADSVRVLDATFAPSSYAIALPPESGRREAINRSMLEQIGAATWALELGRVFRGD